jgi:hypothetical protein
VNVLAAKTSVSTAEKERKKEDYPYTDIRIRTNKTNKTFPNRFQIYVPTILLESFKGGLAAFKLHGHSASKEVVHFVVRYGEVHGGGNPQLTLPPYSDPLAKSPMRVLCAFLNGATTEGRVHCTKYGGSWVMGVKCYGCSSNQLRKQKGSP